MLFFVQKPLRRWKIPRLLASRLSQSHYKLGSTVYLDSLCYCLCFFPCKIPAIDDIHEIYWECGIIIKTLHHSEKVSIGTLEMS